MAQNWLSQILINLSSIWNEDFMTLWHTKLFIKNFDYWPFLFFGILWVERIGTIWAQKIGLKNLMKLTLFIDRLLLKSCMQAIRCVDLINFFCVIFCSQPLLIPPIHILLTTIVSSFLFLAYLYPKKWVMDKNDPSVINGL